jgi:GNAT superfamily N-acetyltransferase
LKSAAPGDTTDVDKQGWGRLMLKAGYHAVAPGMIATVVTSLEMLEPPPLRPETSDPGWRLERLAPDPAEYRRLYRAVGEDWLWFSRLGLSDAELRAIVSHPEVEVYRLSDGAGGVALLELDFRVEDECELMFFGLSRTLIGGPAGRWLMNRAIERAWSRPIRRFWVHTCTLDHPSAVAFYRRSGFRPFRFQVEIAEDPRLLGLAPMDSAPQVPLLTP